jgi:pseudaminic acid cytidylyltransferase
MRGKFTFMNNKTIAIITARGGSKRIPNKNIREFCGHPIIKYSIDAATSSGIFDEVMVSTDSLKIAEIAKQYGANVPFLRSEENSNDFAPTLDVIKEVLFEYKRRGREFDVYCCLYPTAVFINNDLLIQAYIKLIQTKADFLVPIYITNKTIQRAYIKSTDDLIVRKWPEYATTRTQDLEDLYMDSGQFYFGYSDSLLNSGILARTYIELDSNHVHDIDTEEDWIVAQKKYKSMGRKEISFQNLLDTDYQMDLLTWRNQEFVRRPMINSKIITVEEHQKYIELVRKTDTHEVYIALEDGVPFGVINLVFDHKSKTVETGSYLINQQEIGTGKGLIMTFARLSYIFAKPGYTAITKIRKTNQRSIRLQEHMGFEFQYSEAIAGTDEYLLVYSLNQSDWKKKSRIIEEQIKAKFNMHIIGTIPSKDQRVPCE